MFTALSKKHVTFIACNNALAANHLTAADIYQFITIVPAGVVELHKNKLKVLHILNHKIYLYVQE